MNYKKTTLENGLRIITVPMKDNPTVTVFVLVEAGSKYESKSQNGLSHFLEHMCFKGTEKRPSSFSISTELDSIGSIYNAFTSHEYTGYYAKANKVHFGKLLDIVSDMYLNPTFDVKEIEKEKGVIIEEINMYEDLPQRKVQSVFLNLLYGDSPAGRDVLGTVENIKNTKREDFIKYRSGLYVAPATTVVVSGGFDETKAIKEIKKIFAKMPKLEKGKKEKVIEKQTKPAVKIFKKDTDQTHLVLGFRTFGLYDKRSRILNLLVGVLDAGMSSRLFKRLRDEMGVCYYVRAGQDPFTDHGAFSVSAGVDSSRVKEVIGVLLEEIKNLKEKLVGKEELNKVKQNLIGTMYLGLESSDSLSEFYGFQEIMNKKIKTPKDIEEEINKVSSKQIMALAREIFTSSSLNLAIVGRFDNPKEFEDLLKM